ncbi:MAG TPA: cysteine--tRNA ligase, partial [Euryarchaeota archaeon]|nr:cysteine--tRNA ligase [Euryarchaeota archaeon]
MSKSLGNFITLRELLTRHDPQALRFFLLSAHYRHPLDFSERALEDANKGLKRIQTTIFNIKNAMTYASNKGDDSFRGKINSAKKDFLQALCDDFNIPGAIATLFTFTREINAYVAENPGKADLEDALETLRELTGVLGLSFEEEAPELVKGLIEEIIQIRVGFREKKDYEASDNIRERLLSLGISIEDRKQGTVWRFIVSSESQL